ncbi:helix-turn-helix domain-containing protein [Nitrosomonas sp. Nm33]|uniref:helix-turn-helix domain-containing protein n=1 Tax=Nitrosomonas sp. Nm33 TaxID=133724 RepID=UPI000B817A2D|nr:helix-turn-helix domain-containing protein [Nitrosomonas sp. Nm33]
MKRTDWLLETRKMRFEEAYVSYKRGNLTQGEAALLLCLCDRTFRCYLNRYDEGGLDALLDKRLVQVSYRRAPVDEYRKQVVRSTNKILPSLVKP